MKDWEWHSERACPEGQFCDNRANTCCFWCNEEPFCDTACEKVDYSRNIPDVCEAYKNEYEEED